MQLRAITSEDYHFLRLVETTGPIGTRWRFRGTVPSPEAWAQSNMGPTLVQFIVTGKSDRKPIGLVSSYQANFQDGHAYLAAAKFEPEDRSPMMIVGVVLFINYIFSCWNFRKLYMEVPAYNLDQFGSSVGKLAKIEATLSDHLFSAGRYWDQHILAIDRNVWQEKSNMFDVLTKGAE